MAKKITTDTPFVRDSACRSGIAAFKQVFPDGAEVTIENIRKWGNSGAHHQLWITVLPYLLTPEAWAQLSWVFYTGPWRSVPGAPPEYVTTHYTDVQRTNFLLDTIRGEGWSVIREEFRPPMGTPTF